MAWGPAQTALEATKDPCVLENNYIMEYEHPIHGKVRGIGCPIQLSKSPYKTPTCAPEYSQHTEEILLELGYSWEDISRFKDEKVIP
jgi:crotonobetainyl-CoA:carnitine CoA-transferase CaiB-like acyl-CoA transferase